ncbi:hypothetical protein D4740_02650 [Actinomyces sp. 2119]|uniref:Uncharacterized protein n=1 Tax=Actinomyces lilanjuaniae TaxID=2321394 RepID=A0ABN5PS77_9ACTO|nr:MULTISPECIES: hypothetical protein [Actinomyces]AYD90663.1 hypothetical protein D5R93_12825 [Actinomyces lilanjuaniae]RJF43872.1 hypothetical protein D4740_02650 [Actinomyces sp. 2119]
MSATTASISPSAVEAVGIPQPREASQTEGAAVSTADVEAVVTTVTVVLALLAVLGMFIIFAAAAGSLPTVLACAFVSVVICVATAFRLLHRSGM